MSVYRFPFPVDLLSPRDARLIQMPKFLFLCIMKSLQPLQSCNGKEVCKMYTFLRWLGFIGSKIAAHYLVKNLISRIDEWLQ